MVAATSLPREEEPEVVRDTPPLRLLEDALPAETEPLARVWLVPDERDTELLEPLSVVPLLMVPPRALEVVCALPTRLEEEELPLVERETLPFEREVLPVERCCTLVVERCWLLEEGREILAEEREELPEERCWTLAEARVPVDGRDTLLEERLLEPLRELPPPRDWALRSTEVSASAAAAAAASAILKEVLMVLNMILVFVYCIDAKTSGMLHLLCRNFFPESGPYPAGQQCGYQHGGKAAHHDHGEEPDITHLLLEPACEKSGDHHAQGHESGA